MAVTKTKLILALLRKLFIGLIVVALFVIVLAKLCGYIKTVYGEKVMLVFFFTVVVIVGIVSNLIQKKRDKALIETNNKEDNSNPT